MALTGLVVYLLSVYVSFDLLCKIKQHSFHLPDNEVAHREALNCIGCFPLEMKSCKPQKCWLVALYSPPPYLYLREFAACLRSDN